MLLSADDPIMFKFFNKLVANFEKEFIEVGTYMHNYY